MVISNQQGEFNVYLFWKGWFLLVSSARQNLGGTIMKGIEELAITGNRKVWNQLIKRHRENVGDINCSYCPYHKNENIGRHKWRRPQTWKDSRKTQYKPINL